MVGAVLPGVGRFLVVALAWLALGAPAAAAQPNIVFILTDDQRWDTLRYMPTVQSELVGRGVTFANGFVTNPLCCPSRASILTGAYSHTTGVYKNGSRGLREFHDNETSTIATWLDAAGYQTAYVGKYLNGYDGSYIPPGWDRWVSPVLLRQKGGYFDYVINVDGTLREHGALESDYSTDVYAAEATSFIDETPTTRPLFLVFAPHGPHAPATPAPRHASAFADLAPWRSPSYNEADVADKPDWLRSLPLLTEADAGALDAFRIDQVRTLLAVDEAVAGIVDALTRTGRLRDTFIVFTSDNGFHWGEHRLTGKRAPYEESIRVPFVVRYDALSGPRTESPLVKNIDLAPTFAALAGVAAPGAEGQSMLPLVRGDAVAWPARFLVENRGRPRTYCALRTMRYSFVTYATGERELYDLPADPYQLTNVAADPARSSTVAALRKRLARLCNPPPRRLSRQLLCTSEGTREADVLRGTKRYDILCGLRGNDRLYPRRGEDWVYAGRGKDLVESRDGHRDVIVCGRGKDVVRADLHDRVRSDCERVRRA